MIHQPRVRLVGHRFRGLGRGFVPLVMTGALLAEPVPEDPRTTLSEVNERSHQIHDLTAGFVEKKFTSLLQDPLISRGTIRVRGAQTRWDTQEPNPSTLFTDSREVAIYFPDRGILEVYPVDRRLQPLLISPVPRLETLRRFFSVEVRTTDAPRRNAETLELRLVPTEDSVSAFLDEVVVQLDLVNAVVRRVEMIDADGDRTVIEFSNIRINVGLTADDVARKVPAETKIVQPLERGPQQSPGAPVSIQP